MEKLNRVLSIPKRRGLDSSQQDGGLDPNQASEHGEQEQGHVLLHREQWWWVCLVLYHRGVVE